MIRVSVEVSARGPCFRAAVWAESVERAVEVARIHFPDGEVRVLFPINPETFFAQAGPPAGTMLPESKESQGEVQRGTVVASYWDSGSKSDLRSTTA